MTTFPPSVAIREGSKGDPDRSSKWFKLALRETVQVAGRLAFQPYVKAPALRDFGIRDLGAVDDPATMERMEAIYRGRRPREPHSKSG
jgi:hypothetical protein